MKFNSSPHLFAAHALVCSVLLLGACANRPPATPTAESEPKAADGNESVVQRKADEKAGRQTSRVSDRVDQKVDQKTDEAVDSVLDRALGKIFGN